MTYSQFFLLNLNYTVHDRIKLSSSSSEHKRDMHEIRTKTKPKLIRYNFKINMRDKQLSFIQCLFLFDLILFRFIILLRT